MTTSDFLYQLDQSCAACIERHNPEFILNLMVTRATKAALLSFYFSKRDFVAWARSVLSTLFQDFGVTPHQVDVAGAQAQLWAPGFVQDRLTTKAPKIEDLQRIAHVLGVQLNIEAEWGAEQHGEQD